MQAPSNRHFGPARIVALALIALVVGGLAYIGIASGSDPVSVPEGARAGQLTLDSCSYATEDGDYDADCGTLVVPENRADPRSRLIALPVTRIRARSDRPAEPIFRLEGGPGGTNMEFEKASRLADRHDVVLVGYRGVDGSSVLDCPEVESALKGSDDLLGDESFRKYTDGFRACAARLQDEGVDLRGYTLSQRVDDLEAARTALGYDRIDLVSESAGTRTAMIYSWRHPERIHRSVMIGANPPGHFLWHPETTDEQIRRYGELCAKDDGCSRRTDDLVASMRRTAADMPDHWGFLPIKEGHVRTASFYGLMETTGEVAPLTAPMTLDAWLSADEGDASGFWLQSFAADLIFPESFVWGELAATAQADTHAAREYFSSGEPRGTVLGDPGTRFTWGAGGLVDAWPANPGADEYARVQTSQVETLVINGTLDFATPVESASDELMPHLPNGHQVVLPEFGHSTDFWTYQPEANERLLTAFFDRGEVDDSLYEQRAIDFTPEVTQTALAKGIASAMVVLPILVVLSLLWMARRVRKRGAIGRKASAAIRSVYPLFLGLGGWFLGVLVVITAAPSVALDDELLGVLSIGVPIGLATYWAWVHRDWSASTKTAGFVAALGGALVGGALGFGVADGMLALITTIAGATAGANLMLIALDITWERSVGTRFATAGPAPASAEAL